MNFHEGVVAKQRYPAETIREILCTSDAYVTFVSCKLGPPVLFLTFRTFDIHCGEFGACALGACVCLLVFYVECSFAL